MGTVNKTTANINNILNLANGYVAAPFSSATTYAVGDYCSRSGKIYRCKTAGAAAWSSSRWTEVVLGDEVTGINTDIALTSGASSSVSNNSWTLLQTLSVSAGLYLVNYGCSWGGSATGYRQLGLNADSQNAPGGRTVLVAQGTSGAGTSMNGVRIWKFTAAGTLCIWGNQNSGGALTAWPWIEAVKLK